MNRFFGAFARRTVFPFEAVAVQELYFRAQEGSFSMQLLFFKCTERGGVKVQKRIFVKGGSSTRFTGPYLRRHIATFPNV
jgi:hypothetical protein